MAPPIPPTPPPAAPPTGPTNVGLAPNVGGLICYVPCCIGLVFSVVVAIVEKQSRFLRFHAFQSLLFHAALIAVGLALGIFVQVLSMVSAVAAGLLGFVLNTLLFLAALGATIFLMVKAYGNEEFEIPTLGPMARRWV